MASIPIPATPPCPSWCTAHTEQGRDVVHESLLAEWATGDTPDAPAVLGMRRTDELIPGWDGPAVGTGFVTVQFPGQPDAEWLTAAKARGLGCWLIAMAAQLDDQQLGQSIGSPQS